MQTCTYCEGNLETGSNPYGYHEVCHGIVDERIGDGLCGKCGVTPFESPNIFCTVCQIPGVGYTGVRD